MRDAVDLDSAVWTISAMRHENGGRMKMRIEHSFGRLWNYFAN